MQAIYPIGLKFLCDGYVTNGYLLKIKPLIISDLLCDVYVIFCPLLFKVNFVRHYVRCYQKRWANYSIKQKV
jgi:hypothetical protein